MPVPFSEYVIISPVRDEGPRIDRTINCVIAQTVLPREWIIVNDGSADHTGQIADRYSAQHEWIKVIHRKNRGYRKAGGGVIEAFYEGYSFLSTMDWDFIVKLDGDLSFDSDYFEKCFGFFARDPKLGIGGGTVCLSQNGKLKIEYRSAPLFQVRGPCKIYRRACWDQISPLVEAPGWDTIDDVKANMLGWTTRTFWGPNLVHNKPTGQADGSLHNCFKNGRANYITGYHPIFMLAKGVKWVFQKPVFLASAALLAGFLSGYLKGIPQGQDSKAVRYLRQQQIRRLLMRSSIYG